MPPSTKLRRWIAPVSAWLKVHNSGAAWRPAAEANGLTNLRERSFLWMTYSIEGRKGPLHVRFDNVSGNDSRNHLQITVTGIARALGLRTEGVGSRLQRRLGLGEDIETGDDLFDADFLIQGSRPLAHALLDTDARSGLRRLFGTMESTTLAAGALTAQFAHDHNLAFLADDLEQILGLAQRLVEPHDLGTRIARNALEDRTEGVRGRCLLALIADYGGHPAARETLRRCCDDASESVRLEAALAFEEGHHPTLRALASSAESENCAARAIRALGARLEPEEALGLLRANLDGQRHAAAIACIETLGERDRAGTEAEAVLIERGLAHAGENVRRAAALALGRVGTVAAVLPLQEAAQAAGGGSRRAMQDAARAIQSRLQGAERGQLTVSGAEGGTVTLASDGGEVSLPDPDRSRVE